MSNVVQYNTSYINKDTIALHVTKILTKKNHWSFKYFILGSCICICLGVTVLFLYLFITTLASVPATSFLALFKLSPTFSIANCLIVVCESIIAGLLIGLLVKGLRYKSEFGKNFLSEILTLKIFETDPSFFSVIFLSVIVSSVVGAMASLIGTIGISTIFSGSVHEIIGLFTYYNTPLIHIFSGGGVGAGGAGGILSLFIFMVLIIIVGYTILGILSGMVGGMIFGVLFGAINGVAKGVSFSSAFALVSKQYYRNNICEVIYNSMKTGMIQGAIVGGCIGFIQGAIAAFIANNVIIINDIAKVPVLHIDKLGIIGTMIKQLMPIEVKVFIIPIGCIVIFIIAGVYVNRFIGKKKKPGKFLPSKQITEEFIEAASNGHNGTIKRMIAQGMDPSANDYIGCNAITGAAYEGHISTIKLLLNKGFIIDERDGYGMTALMFAAMNGKMEMVRFLIKNGADVNAETNTGKRVLLYAALQNNPEIVFYLIEKGAYDKAGESLKHAKKRGNVYSAYVLETCKGVLKHRRMTHA